MGHRSGALSKVYALNPNGINRWELTTDDAVFASPTLSSTGRLYVGSWDKKLYLVR